MVDLTSVAPYTLKPADVVRSTFHTPSSLSEDKFWLDRDVGLRKRWVLRRKIALVHALESGEIGLEEACQRFAISEDELTGWTEIVRKLKRTNGCKCFVKQQTCSSCAPVLPLQARLARTALGWTFEQAAKGTGVSIRSLTRFESNQFLSAVLLNRIRTAYEAHGIQFDKKKGHFGISVVRN